MDKRVEKTRKLLQDTLLFLLKKYKLDDITVTQLCKSANINRNTFYFHYRDVYDLLSEIESELIREIHPFIGKTKDASETSPLESMCRIYYEKKDILTTITSPGCDRNFTNIILDSARETLMRTWTGQDNISRETAEKVFAFTVGGSVAILQEWIRSGFAEPPEEIASFIERSGAAVVKSAGEKNKGSVSPVRAVLPDECIFPS